MVHVQAILFASLGSSLLSAFLAMLGKQWLNRYDSSDMRGSAVERGQNRQRKLDGMIAWYFDYVMESLPLMLQGARYFWAVPFPDTSGTSPPLSHQLYSASPRSEPSSTFSSSLLERPPRTARTKHLGHSPFATWG